MSKTLRFAGADVVRCAAQQATVTRKKVAGIFVAFVLVFCLPNRSSRSFCRSAARPLLYAAANALIVGP